MSAPNVGAAGPTCEACGRPLPDQAVPASEDLRHGVNLTPGDASPGPKFTVDIRDQVGGRRVFWPGFDAGGDYSGVETIVLSPVYAVKVNRVSVFGQRWGPGEYLERADLLELARVTVPRPAPVARVHPVNLAHRRAQRAADAPAAPSEGEGSTA